MSRRADLENLERLLRQGQLLEARERILKLDPGDIPRPLASPLATFARRAGLFQFSLKLLGPYIRPSSRRPIRPSPEETLEYAASLGSLGCVQEGLDLLKGLSGANLPELGFHVALLHFREWEYAKAISHLQTFIGQAELDPYRRLVGHVNLAAAFVFERRPEADGLLHRLENEARGQGHERILGNTLELRAQVAIRKESWGQAQQLLQESEVYLRASGGLEPLFVRKWQALLKLFRDGDSEQSRRAMREVRKAATRLGDPETVRDCDFQEGLFTARAELIKRVYFGTPYPSYRERVKRELMERGLDSGLLGSVYQLDLPGAKTKNYLDIATGDHSFKSRPLTKPESRVQAVLRALVKDFYKPPTTAVLFSEVYPDRHFNLDTSPNCVYQLMHRLRRDLAEARIPLVIRERQGAFHMTGAVSLRIALSGKPQIPRKLLELARDLRARFGRGAFSSKQAALSTKTSQRSMSRYLGEAEMSGLVSSKGQTRATRYRVNAPSRPRDAKSKTQKSR